MISDKVVLPENQTNLDTGQIKFHNNYLSTLPAGDYTVKLTQTIEGDGLEEKVFEKMQKFEVAGPRFRLPEGEIHSVYPPPNGEEYYEGVLPQITFRKRTLPWERSVDSIVEDKPPKGEGFEIPWMALLLFEENELEVLTKDRKNATRTRAVSRATDNLLDPPDNYLLPLEWYKKPNSDRELRSLSKGLGDEESCYTIDISVGTFLQIAPKTNELAYLAHVREVNTDDKEFLGMHADGWFSVMLSNRLPKTPPVQSVEAGSVEEKKGVNFARNIVHLVSLEGFIPYLEDPKTWSQEIEWDLQAKDKVRLVSLASWEFYCKPPLESFEKLMEDLDTDTLKIRASVNADQSPNHAYLKTALEGGYIPLQYNTRNGEKTMAWYRGPLIPVINEYSPEVEDEDVFFSGEGSMIYDDKKGLFELSQAAAWQIGRLLALNDAHFSNHLLDWKKLVNRKIDEVLKRQSLVLRDGVNTDSLDESSDEFETLDLKKVQELMSEEFATNLFGDNFLKRLAIAKGFFEEMEVPTLLELELENLPGIIEKERYKEIMEAGKDPELGLLEAVFED